jgi:hypothetical protein
MPSKPAGNSNQQTSSTTQVQLPDWINSAAQGIVGASQQYAQNLPQYQVAPITQGGQQDIQALQNNVGSTNAAYQQAQTGTQQQANYNPQQVTPGFLSGTDLSPYMNPYTQSVINATMPLIDQQRQLANNQSADLAAKTGAFGGSRQGVQEAVNNAQSGLYAGQLGAQLNQANFGQAQAAAQADLNRSLTAQQSNQAAGLQGAGLNLAANQQIGNLASQGQNAFLAGAQGGMAGQTQLQQQQQAVSNSPWQDALQRMQLQEQAIGSVPYGQTQTSTGTGPGPTSNPWLTGLGGAASLASIAGTVAPLLSDRTMKTDIDKIGKDEETDLPLYAYRYKTDPKTYPKIVGIMAQDAQKKYPEQVVEVGGKLAVRSNFLSGIMERANGNP